MRGGLNSPSVVGRKSLGLRAEHCNVEVRGHQLLEPRLRRIVFVFFFLPFAGWKKQILEIPRQNLLTGQKLEPLTKN